MMDYYKKVSSQRADYMRKRRELEDREYDTVNKVKVKIIRDDTDKVTCYESNYFYNRSVTIICKNRPSLVILIPWVPINGAYFICAHFYIVPNNKLCLCSWPLPPSSLHWQTVTSTSSKYSV